MANIHLAQMHRWQLANWHLAKRPSWQLPQVSLHAQALDWRLATMHHHWNFDPEQENPDLLAQPLAMATPHLTIRRWRLHALDWRPAKMNRHWNFDPDQNSPDLLAQPLARATPHLTIRRWRLHVQALGWRPARMNRRWILDPEQENPALLAQTLARANPRLTIRRWQQALEWVWGPTLEPVMMANSQSARRPLWRPARHLPLLLLMPMGMEPQHCAEESPPQLQRKQPLVTPPWHLVSFLEELQKAPPHV